MNETNSQMMNNTEKTANGLSISEITQVVKEQMNGYGEADGMSIAKLVKLLAGAVTGKKDVYQLAFVKDDDTWYVDLPQWPWKRENLAMVCGADKMLDLLAATPENDKGPNRVNLEVKPADNPLDDVELQKLLSEDWLELTQTKSTHWRSNVHAQRQD